MRFKGTQFDIKLELHLRQFTFNELKGMEDELATSLNAEYCSLQCSVISAINKEMRKRLNLA